MHPAVRVFLVALVIVLVCSHLILNMMTDKPASVVSRHLTSGSVRHPGEGKTIDHRNNELMDTIGDMKNRELLVGKTSHARNGAEKSTAKIPVEVEVQETTMRQDANSDDVDGDGDERKDEGEDFEGKDGDSSD